MTPVLVGSVKTVLPVLFDLGIVISPLFNVILFAVIVSLIILNYYKYMIN